MVKDPDSRLFGMLLISFLGFCAFWFKKKNKLWYGFFEVFFALIACYSTFESIQVGFHQKQLKIATIITVVSTIYFVARGMENIDKGRSESYSFKDDLTYDNMRKILNIKMLIVFVIITVMLYFVYTKIIIYWELGYKIFMSIVAVISLIFRKKIYPKGY